MSVEAQFQRSEISVYRYRIGDGENLIMAGRKKKTIGIRQRLGKRDGLKLYKPLQKSTGGT